MLVTKNFIFTIFHLIEPRLILRYDSWKFRWSCPCWLLWLSFLSILSAQTSAQHLVLNPDLRFETYDGSNKLTTGFMAAVARTHDGYIWVPANGLYRFDGVNYTLYSKFENARHGLRENYISDLVEDAYGRLWVGNSGGICYYDKKLDRFNYIDIDSGHRFTHSFGLCLAKSKLWFLSNLGLSYIDLRTLKSGSLRPGLGSTALTLCAVEDNIILCSENSGSYLLYHIDDGRFERIKLPPAHASPVSCVVKYAGKYWIGGYGGLWVTEKIDREAVFVSGSEGLNITDIAIVPAVTGDSILWVGTLRSGLVLFNLNSRKLLYSYRHNPENPHSLVSDEVFRIFPDRENLIWIGTSKGLSLFNYRNQAVKTRLIPDKYLIAAVPDVFDTAMVWFSFHRKGFQLTNWATKTAIRSIYSLAGHTPDKAEGSSVLDMRQIDKDRWLVLSIPTAGIWNARTSNLELSFKFPVKQSLFPLWLRHIIPYNRDSCFITSNNGLYLVRIPSAKVEAVLPRLDTAVYSDFDIMNGQYDGKGHFWLATRNGLMKYDLASGNKTMYRCGKKLERNYLGDAVIDHKNNRIVSTAIDGISVFEISSCKFRFIEKIGEINRPGCHAIYLADSIAWINSDAGLIRMNVNTLRADISQVVEQQFSSNLPFGRIGDELVICQRDRYTYFNPSKLVNPLPSPPLIEKVMISDSTVYFPGEVATSLPYDRNTIGFYFTAFEFSDPVGIRFRYRLKGSANNNWTYTESRTANYIQLPPGHYSFEVQSGGRQGKWNSRVSIYTFEIKPPFWQTWWFGVLLLFGFLLLVTGVVTWRIRYIKRREAEKTAHNKSIAEMEMQVLLNQMNPHFIFNSLNSIQKFIWENKQEDAAEYLTKFSRLIRMILDNSVRKWITLEEELDALSLYIELEHRRCNNKFDYLIHVDPSIETDSVLLPSLLLQPYVENAIWHGLINKAGRGYLKVSIAMKEGEMICCVIEDDGIGREASVRIREKGERKSVSYGLQITKQRVEMIRTDNAKGSVVVEDLFDMKGIPAGTRVIVNIPVSVFIKV